MECKICQIIDLKFEGGEKPSYDLWILEWENIVKNKLKYELPFCIVHGV